MKKEITAKAIFHLFKMHYEDAEYFLSMAKESKKQNNGRMEWRYSRTSILSYYFSIEALINLILYRMHNKKLCSRLTLVNLEKMSIHDKYLLAPLICEGFSGEALDVDDLERLNNLSNLRNDYVHSKYINIKKPMPITEVDVVTRILTTNEGLKEVLPEVLTKDEKYNRIDIKKNIIDLGYEDALRMKKITDRLFEKMNHLLKGLLLGKKDLPGISENELFAERVGVAKPWIKSDFFAGLSKKEFKEFDDYQLKGMITNLLEEELSGEDKKILSSFSAREREEFIIRLVKEFKKRRSYVEDRRNLY
jgi:hypothetical protein